MTDLATTHRHLAALGPSADLPRPSESLTIPGLEAPLDQVMVALSGLLGVRRDLISLVIEAIDRRHQ